MDTHSSKSKDAPWSNQSCAGVRPGWRSGYPLIQVHTCPLVQPVVHKLVDQMEEWTSTHHNAEMPSDLTSGVKPIGTCLRVNICLSECGDVFLFDHYYASGQNRL